jgi:hypothetical protein
MFVSVNGKAKEVKEIFAGGSDGLAHKVDEVFSGVDGIAKLVYTSKKREPNGFDQFTWAEIKELADNGLLLNYFKRYDMVDIKLKEPIVRTMKDYEIIQNSLPMVVSEICETGMRLVAHIAIPYSFNFKIDNDLYWSRLQTDIHHKVGTTSMWGMCSGLYNGIKVVDNLLPDDMREVLRDFEPLYKYEYYYDDEGKQRLLQEYDDCRVRQITSNGYSYHKEYVEERERDEYILDTTYFARTESGYKKFIPEELRYIYDEAYGIQSLFHHKNTTANWPYTSYKLMWQNPEVAWIWDWENYWGTNGLGYMKSPIYTTTSQGGGSNIVPEVQIGEIEETLDKL